MDYFANHSPSNQVNGKDISRASCQQVLEILQSPGEQTTLEVHRQKSAHEPPQTSDAATQTDFRAGNKQCCKDENCSKSDLNLHLERYVQSSAQGKETCPRKQPEHSTLSTRSANISSSWISIQLHPLPSKQAALAPV